MKKLLFPLLFTLTVSFSFAQEISGAKPVLSINGVNIQGIDPSFLLGCDTPETTITANFVANLGSPDSYRVEQIPWREHAYLPTSGNTVLTPTQLGVPGQMLSNLGDDKWSSIQQLASGGSNLEFCYFGESKTEFVISSNVILSFDTSYAGGHSEWHLEPMDKIEPNANCYGLMDGPNRDLEGNNDAILEIHDTDPSNPDADFDSYSFWAILGQEHERFFIMGSHHMPMFLCGADYGYATHQMVFYETTNIIEFNIRDKPLCDNWNGGFQAFGLQNNGKNIGFSVPGLDNLTQYQILNSNDPYSMAHVNSAAPVHDSVSYRFIPDGTIGTPPDFKGWYTNWDSVNNTGTPVTDNNMVDPTNPTNLTVHDSDLPFDSNGDPMPITYTAVVEYVEFCSGNIYYATSNVTFEAIPVRMHIVEDNAPDPNIETIDVEQITFCEGEGYTLQANVSSNDPSYTIEWTEEPSGGSASPVDDNDGDPLTYSIPTTTLPGIYRYTCTLTSYDSAGNVTCTFSDEVVVTIISEPTMEYPAPKAYCINKTDAFSGLTVSPTAPNTATQDEIELYYFTIAIGGTTINHTDPDPNLDLNKDVWEDSLDMVPVANQDDPANPDWSEHSLSGKVNMSFAYQYAKDNNLLNPANEAEVTITYHAYCEQNSITDNIILRDAPLVLNPSVGDSTVTPVIEPSLEITECETDAVNHTADFDITSINTYIANGIDLADLNIVWESQAGVALPSTGTFNTATIAVKVTVTLTSDTTASCPEELLFDLKVIQTNITELQDTTTTPLTLCENDTNTDQNIHTAIFDTANWDEAILIDNYDNTVTPPTIDPNYFVEYTYVDTDGNTIVTDDVNTIPANIELSSQTIKAIVKYKINDTTFCESEEKTFDVTVINTPIIDDLPTQDIILCETDPTNHTAEFDTTSWKGTILGTQSPTDYYITYTAFEVAADGTETPYTLPTTFPEATNSSTLPSLKIKVEVNTDITTVDVNNNPTTTTCSSTTISEFYIKVIEEPIATPLVNTVNDPSQPTDIALILCETDTDNHTAEFDTTNWNSKILENYYDNSVNPPIDPNYSVEYRAVTVDPVTLVETPYALPNPFPEATNSSTLPSLKIYIKAYYKIDNNTKCYGNEKSFLIESNPSPKIKVPTDPNFPAGSETLEMCESDTNPDPDIHTAIFDTTNWLNTILDGQTGNNYHVVLTAKDINGVDVTLLDPLPINFETESIIITAIVKDDNIPCDSVSKEFKLDVRVVPENNEIEDMIQCEDDNNTDPNVHTSTFDTTDWTSTVLGSQDPTNLVVEYTYELENGTQVTVEDPDDATNNIAGLPNEIISSSQTVHVVVRNVNSTIDPHTSCDSAEKTFDLVVINTPTYVIQNDITQCEDDTNTDQNIHESGFDTTGWDTAIKGTTQTDSHYSVVYSAFTIDPITNNEIPYILPDPLPAILNVPSITIRYQVRYNIDNNTYCESIPPNINPNQNTFDLNVRLIPFIAQLEDDMDTTGLIDLEICDDDNDSNTFTAQFDTTNWNKAILKDNYDNTVNPPTINPDFIIEYTYEDITGVSQTVNSTNLPNPLPLYSQTIKYTVKNITTGEATCPSEEKEFEVIVDLLPVGTNGKAVVCSGSQNYITIDNGSVTPPTYKDFTFDDFATFTDVDNNGNRNTYKWKVINDNPNITGESFSYVDNGDNTNPTITDVLINTTSNVQFVNYEVIPVSEFGCEGEPFNIQVQVDVVPVIIDHTETICNEEELSLNLDSYTILTGNSYKWHAIDNPNVTGETTDETNTTIIEDTIINTTGTVQTVEYMVTPTSAGGCEGDEFLVAVDVNPRPEFDLKPQYLICPDVHEVNIGEDSNPDDYTYQWYKANNMNVSINNNNQNPKILVVTEADLAASNNGTYVLTVTDTLGCTYSQFTSVSMAEQVAIAEIHVSDFNRPNNTIQIDVTGGSGQFEYTLNYIDYAGSSQSITQSSPIFENVVGGSYQIEVTDLTGCSVVTTSQDIYVLDYPTFFTPNGDLQHDTWQITGAQFIPNSKIYIFDRFGKVLAQVNPNSVIGWDGTYRGEQVPASDYWFTCEYIDPNTGNQKSVKGHFSIIRK